MEAETWWEKEKGKFKTGIYLGLGKPVFLPDIISLLKEKPE
jgi:hypothetical protein